MNFVNSNNNNNQKSANNYLNRFICEYFRESDDSIFEAVVHSSDILKNVCVCSLNYCFNYIYVKTFRTIEQLGKNNFFPIRSCSMTHN